MQNTFLLTLFLSFATMLEAQTLLPKRNTSLGIDLIVAITTLSDNATQYSSSLELIYKEHLEKSAIRFRVSATSFLVDRTQFRGFKRDSISIRSYHQPSKQYGLALGGEYQVTTSKHPMYVGLDLGFNFIRGTVEIDRCLSNICEVIQFIDAKNSSFEITPFLGWEFNLTPRFFLNIELGPYILFNFGDRPFADEQETVQISTVNETEVNFGRMLRDISINYRF